MSQQINLFNPVFLVQQKHFSLLTIVQALALILLGAGLLYVYAAYQVYELSKQFTESSKRFAAEQVRLAGQTAEFSPQSADQLLQDRLRVLEKKAAESKQLADSLRDSAVGNSTGYSEYMRAFARQVMPGIWLTGFNLKGNATYISLSGGALNPELVPVYIQKLRRESIMQGKRFSALLIQQPKAEENHGEHVEMKHYVSFTLQSLPDDEARQ